MNVKVTVSLTCPGVLTITLAWIFACCPAWTGVAKLMIDGGFAPATTETLNARDGALPLFTTVMTTGITLRDCEPVAAGS